MGNRAGIATSYHNLGILAQLRGNYAEAERHYQQSLAIKVELGNRNGVANSYHNLGILAQDRGDYPEAERRYQQSLTINEELGNRAGIATTYSQIGNLAEERRSISEAAAWHLRALVIRASIGVPQVVRNAQRLLTYRAAFGAEAFERIAVETVGDQVSRVIELLDRFAEESE